MPIRVFPPHYQLVYISFDISSFSLISYKGTFVPIHGYNCTFTIVNTQGRFYVFINKRYTGIVVYLLSEIFEVTIL